MIWGAMSSAGVGPFCFLKTNVTSPVYQDILEHFMLPSADQLFKDADFIFQQDLATAHTAKSTKSWLNDHGVGVLDWPANSPDLNIENIWSIIMRKMRKKRPKNADELKATVKETWASYHLSSAVSLVPVCLGHPPPPPREDKRPSQNQQKLSIAYVTAASHPVLTVSSSSPLSSSPRAH